MDQGYLISIITPSHNTPDDLFRAAFDSVISQTLDEARIEWVIVVHNSASEHLEYVQKLCKDHPNFCVYELHNDKHTASSPRNHALTKVRGKYVTFLDADDRLTSECLETAVKGMEETGAQLGKFRSEKLEEDTEIMSFLDNRVRFDQTKPLICLHKDDPDVCKLMTMSNMMMSSQIVERTFIERFGIRFSENVRIYEDVVFNMQCLSHADTIAVFPQMIGYIYYMHHGSTMQEIKAPAPDTILATCRDIAYQLDFGVRSGLYMRYLFFGHMKQLADMIEASENTYDFPDDIRQDIKELLKPFFSRIEPPEPDRKFLSREEIEEIISYSRRKLLGPEDEDERNASPDTTEVLIDILRSAEETEIGENWGFDRIRSHEAYAKDVGVNTYDTFSPMIELMSRIGESDILFSDPIVGYAVTSGSMDVPRRIPHTERTISAFVDMFRRILTDEDAGGGSCFLLAGSVKGDKPFADRTYPDSITGAVLQVMRKEFTYDSHLCAESEDLRLTGPEELYFLEVPIDPRYLRLLFALLDRNVSQIASPFTWSLLDTFRYLERHHEELVSDIESGKLDGAPWLSSEERETYSSRFNADPERAQELRRIFAEGFDEPVIPKIWPECRRINAGGSADFSLYTHHLKRYSGAVPVISAAHVASEAVIGTDCGDGCYRLEYGENYFEFIPEDENGADQRALSAEELEEGRYYNAILTNRAGLYRYNLGDTIKIERMDNGVPIYSLAGRSYGMLKIPQESGGCIRIRPCDVTELLLQMEERFDVNIEDYCIAWDEDNSYISLYIEPSGDYVGRDKLPDVSKTEFEIAAEKILCRIVPDYGSAVSEGRIQPLRTCMLQSETHLSYRDKRMYVSKVAPDQIKPSHMIGNNPAAQRFFDSFCVEDRK